MANQIFKKKNTPKKYKQNHKQKSYKAMTSPATTKEPTFGCVIILTHLITSQTGTSYGAKKDDQTDLSLRVHLALHHRFTTVFY